MKLMIIFVLLILLIIEMSFGEDKEVEYFDLSNSDHGVLTVINPNMDAKIKLMVSSEGERIFYNITEESESFSLQFGSGSYSFELYANIEGDSYEMIAKKVDFIQLNNDLEPFLSKIQNVYWDDDMKPIIKAGKLAEASDEDFEKLSAIYNYVISNIVYDYDKIEGLSYSYVPDVEKIYSEGKGICYDYASLLAAMLRSVDIPTKVVKGYRDGLTEYHAWNKVFVDEHWITVDPTYDSANHLSFEQIILYDNEDTYNEVYEY